MIKFAIPMLTVSETGKRYFACMLDAGPCPELHVAHKDGCRLKKGCGSAVRGLRCINRGGSGALCTLLDATLN